MNFTESAVEDAALAWLEGLGYAVLHGPEIAVGEPSAERSDPNYRDVVLDSGCVSRCSRSPPAICGSRTLRSSSGWAGAARAGEN